MKVKVSVTLEVDADAWAEEYGIDRSEVRADVGRWVRGRLNRYDDEVARIVPPKRSAHD